MVINLLLKRKKSATFDIECLIRTPLFSYICRVRVTEFGSFRKSFVAGCCFMVDSQFGLGLVGWGRDVGWMLGVFVVLVFNLKLNSSIR